MDFISIKTQRSYHNLGTVWLPQPARVRGVAKRNFLHLFVETPLISTYERYLPPTEGCIGVVAQKSDIARFERASGPKMLLSKRLIDSFPLELFNKTLIWSNESVLKYRPDLRDSIFSSNDSWSFNGVSKTTETGTSR